MAYFDNSDTICAVATPHGKGGIAVVRVSGPEAVAIVDSVWKGRSVALWNSHTAHLGLIVDESGEVLDQAVGTYFKAPNSFTGEDVVELSVHGSRWIQRRVLEVLIAKGARMAEAGEFTRRAFRSGKLDLAEAEAVADLIDSTSRAAHRIALGQMRGGFSRRLDSLREELLNLASLLELELDFSEEEVEFASRERLRELSVSTAAEIRRLANSFRAGAAIKEGVPVAIIGNTNAGKSSLLNALLGDERAIVSDIHGTTRDIVEDRCEMGEYLVRFMDTAGLRETDDVIENIGIGRSRQAASKADVVLYVVDGEHPESPADIAAELAGIEEGRAIVVWNKVDSAAPTAGRKECVAISAKTGQGIDELRTAIVEVIRRFAPDAEAEVTVTNLRHATALSQAADAMERVTAGLEGNIPTDFVAQDLREALHHLASVTGTITTPDILTTIFSRFCIGK